MKRLPPVPNGIPISARGRKKSPPLDYLSFCTTKRTAKIIMAMLNIEKTGNNIVAIIFIIFASITFDRRLLFCSCFP